MSKMNQLAAMLTMAAMSGGSFIASGRGDELETFTPIPKEPPIPKGCQKYVYKESFGTLEVIALNEKSALRKYNKWCNANSRFVV